MNNKKAFDILFIALMDYCETSLGSDEAKRKEVEKAYNHLYAVVNKQGG